MARCFGRQTGPHARTVTLAGAVSRAEYDDTLKQLQADGFTSTSEGVATIVAAYRDSEAIRQHVRQYRKVQRDASIRLVS